MWEANFYKKWTYGLGIMKFFSFRTKLRQLKKIIFKIFFVNFFGNIFLTKFLLELPTNSSCNVHEINKDRLQSLTKRSCYSG